MSEPATGARLVVVQGDASRREVSLDQPAVVGRGETCDLVLLDGAASRRHARIETRGNGGLVTDLDSTNGTFVNGRRVRESPLIDGDEVAIGAVRLRFRAAIPGETLVVGGHARSTAPGAPREVPLPTGRSNALLRARAMAERASGSDLPVLLRGATGTGKEVFAHFIHARSKRAAGPFVALHAAAIPASLLDAELFGHERGAFTGADARREGYVARAGGGTLFLDEVGELPAEAQVKLLRVLETGEFHPVGSSQARRSDFRLIAATNRDLDRAVRDGQFRGDLLFRMNAIEIAIPTLRERLDDLPALVAEMLAPTGKRAGAGLLEAIATRAWPGNVRELRHALERAALVSEGNEVGADHLPIATTAIAPAPASSNDPTVTADASLDGAEKEAIVRALAATNGRRGEAARLLGIAEPTLRRKCKKYGLG